MTQRVIVLFPEFETHDKSARKSKKDSYQVLIALMQSLICHWKAILVVIATFANSNSVVQKIAATWYLLFEKVTSVVGFLIGDTGIISNKFISLKSSFGFRESLNLAYFMSHVYVPGWMAKRRPTVGYVDLKLDFGPEFGIGWNTYFVSYNGRNSKKFNSVSMRKPGRRRYS